MENTNFPKALIGCAVAFTGFTLAYSAVIRTQFIEETKIKGVYKTPIGVELFNLFRGSLGLLGMYVGIKSLRD